MTGEAVTGLPMTGGPVTREAVTDDAADEAAGVGFAVAAVVVAGAPLAIELRGRGADRRSGVPAARARRAIDGAAP